MKKFIGAMIFGVIVVIIMVTQWTREQTTEPAPATPFNAPLEGQMQPTAGDTTMNRAEQDRWSLDNYDIIAIEGAYEQDINLQSVPYRLDSEGVDNQWFREMEQALYSISHEALEPDGMRMVNLECATTVCVADFEIPAGAELSVNAFLRASRKIDALDSTALSMTFLAGNDSVVERIIFQRKE